MLNNANILHLDEFPDHICFFIAISNFVTRKPNQIKKKKHTHTSYYSFLIFFLVSTPFSVSKLLKKVEIQPQWAFLWENCWTRNELFVKHLDAFQSLRNVLLGSEQALLLGGSMVWMNRPVPWCLCWSGITVSGTESWRELAAVTLVLSHQGLHSNSTIMSLSARCEP